MCGIDCEMAARERIRDDIRFMVNDYPTDVWPEPAARANDAQAADVLRRSAVERGEHRAGEES